MSTMDQLIQSQREYIAQLETLNSLQQELIDNLTEQVRRYEKGSFLERVGMLFWGKSKEAA